MSIIRIKEINTYNDKGIVSREYKLWGIPVLKYTYEDKGTKPTEVRVLGASEGAPLSVQESL